jgi:hypothetical protein
VLDRENERISWIDAYLNGETSLYRGPWSADRVVSRDGMEPESRHLAFENARATFMRNSEAVFIEVLYPDIPTYGFLLKQSFAQPGTTRFILYAYSSDWSGTERECDGCFVDFASQPSLVTADALVLDPGSGDEVTLNIDFRRVPIEALTGDALVPFASDDLRWRFESGQWVAASCENYRGSGQFTFAEAWYRVDYFIDDANPRAHGVRAITVLACDETCSNPEFEGDYCPPLPDPAACR